jgi:hypothetical protein
MRKMRLVPTSSPQIPKIPTTTKDFESMKIPEDVQVKLIQNILASRIPKNEDYGYDYQTSRSVGIQTSDALPRSVQTESVQVQDTGVQGKTMQSVDAQTEETEMHNAFAQTESLTNILVKRYMDKVNHIIKLLGDHNYRWNLGDLKLREPPDVEVVPLIEHLVVKLLRKPVSPTIGQIEKIIFPPPLAKRTSPAVAGQRLLRQAKEYDTKRARTFDVMSYPFEEK